MKTGGFFFIILMINVFGYSLEGFYSDNISSPVYYELNFNYQPIGTISSDGKGFDFTFGINAASFVSKTWIFSVFGGASFTYGNSYAPGFITEFRNSTIKPGRLSELEVEYNNDNDSTLTHSEELEYHSLKNGLEMMEWLSETKLNGDGKFIVGIAFRPDIPFFPIIKAYWIPVYFTLHKSASGVAISPIGGGINYNSSPGFALSRSGFGLSVITFRGYTIQALEILTLNIFDISLYAEWLSFSDVEIVREINDSYGLWYKNNRMRVSFDSFLTDFFKNKYRNEYRFGISIGIGSF